MRFGFWWFIGLIVLEYFSISQMAKWVGGWATFILLIGGFYFGLKLMRAQGIQALMASAQKMDAGSSPLNRIAEGVINALAGILFLFPGFVSDIIAVVLLLPPVKKGMAQHLAKQGQFGMFAGGQGGMFSGSFGAGGFSAGGFGRSAGQSQEAGNVYEHEGSAEVNQDPAGVIEHQSSKK